MRFIKILSYYSQNYWWWVPKPKLKFILQSSSILQHYFTSFATYLNVLQAVPKSTIIILIIDRKFQSYVTYNRFYKGVNFPRMQWKGKVMMQIQMECTVFSKKKFCIGYMILDISSEWEFQFRIVFLGLSWKICNFLHCYWSRKSTIEMICTSVLWLLLVVWHLIPN